MGIMITDQSKDREIIYSFSSARTIYKESPSKSKPVYTARRTSAFHIFKKWPQFVFLMFNHVHLLEIWLQSEETRIFTPDHQSEELTISDLLDLCANISDLESNWQCFEVWERWITKEFLFPSKFYPIFVSLSFSSPWRIYFSLECLSRFFFFFFFFRVNRKNPLIAKQRNVKTLNLWEEWNKCEFRYQEFHIFEILITFLVVNSGKRLVYFKVRLVPFRMFFSLSKRLLQLSSIFLLEVILKLWVIQSIAFHKNLSHPSLSSFTLCPFNIWSKMVLYKTFSFVDITLHFLFFHPFVQICFLQILLLLCEC